MNAMKKEIVRLSNSLIDEKKKEPKRGEFENHTKGFGSSYVKKFGFADGKGLGKQEQGTKDPIPFILLHTCISLEHISRVWCRYTSC
jgi:hypothetical protein